MKALVTGVAAVLLGWLFVAGFGGITVRSPTGLDVQLESDYAAVQLSAQRNETERTRIAAELEQSRAALAAQAGAEQQVTLRLFAVVAGLVAVVVVVARRKEPPTPTPAILAYIAANYPAGSNVSPGYVDGQWVVLDDDNELIVYPRLLTDRRAD